MVEFFGAHEFALLKPDALRPLSTLDKSPNKSVREMRDVFSTWYRYIFSFVKGYKMQKKSTSGLP